MTQDQEPTIICVAEVALDMCGRCARPLNGSTNERINHFSNDPEHATCSTVSGKFKPAPRFCMLAEEDHKNNIPEIVEALGRVNWNTVGYHTNPTFGIDREGHLILARAASTVLAGEPHVFEAGILCPSCRGERLLDKIVGSVPGLRSETRMPIVSGKKTRCSECGGAGIKASTPSV